MKANIRIAAPDHWRKLDETRRTRPIPDALNQDTCLIASALRASLDEAAGERRRQALAKAYWVATYRSVTNPDALAAYAALSGPAVVAAGGRILVRGMPAYVHEAGLAQRTVVIEFDSLEQAKAAHDSAAYQEALAALAGGAERDFRIVEGPQV